MKDKNIPEKLERFIRDAAEGLHYQVVDVRSKGRDAFNIEIILDKEVGITIAECSDFNRRVVSWIESEKLFGGKHFIDVCSPGLDRAIKTDGDFVWAKGKEVDITLNEPIDGKSKITGKLLETSTRDDIEVEETEGHTFRVKRDNAVNIRLHFVMNKRSQG